MSQLQDDIESAIQQASARLDDEAKQLLADSVKRASVHVAAGNLSLLKIEANTVSAILWTDANERGKQARQAIINAVTNAVVKGIIVAI